MRLPVALSVAFFLATSIVAHAQDQTVSVGPWTIATSSKGDKFDSCTMSRSTNDLNITFVRGHDGLLLLLDSSKWKLERGKAYDVTLIAGSRSVQAKAMAENKSVTIPLADRPLNERVRAANILEVKGEGATLKVPLNGSTAALERMEACFEKNSRAGVESNPSLHRVGSPKVTMASQEALAVAAELPVIASRCRRERHGVVRDRRREGLW